MTLCEKCGCELQIGDFPFCPHGRGSSNRGHDEIPGGMWIENLGPQPVKVYSHTERLRLAKESGCEEFVRHQPIPGTDKSPFTTDWSKGSIDPYTLEAARVLVSRQSEPKGSSGDLEGVLVNRVTATMSTAEARTVLSILRGK